MLVLGYHHPLEIVKRYGTLDLVSRGRLILGVGVGSLEEEFALLGAEFGDRGARADDAIRALRASFGHEEPEYHGEHYDYAGVMVRPAGIQTPPPIWIGGRTARSLRRAVELGDGWAPFGLPVDAMAEMLTAGRDPATWSCSPIARSTPSMTPAARHGRLRHCATPARRSSASASSTTRPSTTASSSPRCGRSSTPRRPSP